jgi:site-specific DNA-methyltransferase (adenine-specific)
MKIMNMILNTDGIEYMKGLFTKSIDLILTDPPYNVGMNYGEKYDDKKSYDEYLNWSKEWFNEAKRISNSVIFTPGYVNMEMWLNKIEYPKGIVVLYLPNECCSSNLGGFNHWEPLLVYGKALFGKNVLKHNITKQKDIGNHPCPKQLSLYIDILEQIRPKPNCVFDPFAGSGTTLLAANKLKYNYIGCEINPIFINNINKRIHDDNSQMRFL